MVPRNDFESPSPSKCGERVVWHGSVCTMDEKDEESISFSVKKKGTRGTRYPRSALRAGGCLASMGSSLHCLSGLRTNYCSTSLWTKTYSRMRERPLTDRKVAAVKIENGGDPQRLVPWLHSENAILMTVGLIDCDIGRTVAYEVVPSAGILNSFASFLNTIEFYPELPEEGIGVYVVIAERVEQAAKLCRSSPCHHRHQLVRMPHHTPSARIVHSVNRLHNLPRQVPGGS